MQIHFFLTHWAELAKPLAVKRCDLDAIGVGKVAADWRRRGSRSSRMNP